MYRLLHDFNQSKKAVRGISVGHLSEIFMKSEILRDVEFYLILFTPRSKDALIVVKKTVVRFVFLNIPQKNIVNAAVSSANYMNKTITIDVLT